MAENGTAFAATEQGDEKSIVYIKDIRFLTAFEMATTGF